MYYTDYIEMRCIGDYADFVVYGDDTTRWRASSSTWMVPGSWEGRDEFGRPLARRYEQEA